MEERKKNLCAMLPVSLHARVRREQEKAGMTLGEYVEALITEYYGSLKSHRTYPIAAWFPASVNKTYPAYS